ncbi:PfkB domain protein [uncultured Spirochaetota bacterium]|jgi:2-dehydro-3-deoxygluconokinase|uniref:PfkB domain protein n=1 Tax=uncultured Spirochaetota bacterium TaxID=460511 RepID=A0A653A0E9_9SPIR|nr:PfkB domain protein [uncultured Spirochaetota bacterium]
MSKTIGFGEIMGRINMPQHKRFIQGLPGSIELTFAGAESNVCVAIRLLGQQAAFVTALPKNDIADACIMTLQRIGVDVSNVLRVDEGRLGLYFVENGANQRPGKVIYDRGNASISIVSSDRYEWDTIFKDATWFHISGITPALSATAAETSIDAVRKAKDNGCIVSCDLNFRKKLWKWDTVLSSRELARKVMAKILPYVDILIGNEEDAEDVLDIKAGNTEVYSGILDIDRYPDVAKQIHAMFPQIKKVAITLRESISASHNNWGAMLYDTATSIAHFAPMDANGNYCPYEIRDIVDRIGGGDSFSGSLIYALQDVTLNRSDKDTVAFAVAASCLCHSIEGDFNFISREEVLSLANGDASGRVKR